MEPLEFSHMEKKTNRVVHSRTNHKKGSGVYNIIQNFTFEKLYVKYQENNVLCVSSADDT